MKQLIVSLVLILGLVGCASNPTPAPSPTRDLSASGMAAYNAAKVVQALDLIRDIAIDAEKQTPKVISTDATRKVVLYHQSALKTINAVPGGWKPVVMTGLTELEGQLAAGDKEKLAPYISLLKSLLGVIL